MSAITRNGNGELADLRRRVQRLEQNTDPGEDLHPNYYQVNPDGSIHGFVFIDTIFFNVKDHGAKGDGATDDTTAINNTISLAAAAGGGTVFLPAGVYRCSGQIASTASNVTLMGAGSTGTVILYTGSSAALAWGPAYPTALVPNCNLALINLAVLTNGAATEGIVIRRLQGFYCQNVYVAPQANPALGFQDWRFEACNSGTLINCNAQGQGFSNSSVGALYTDNPDSGANLITWIGGAIEGAICNVQSIFNGGDYQNANRFIGVNIAVPQQAPNILLDGTRGWTFDGCFLENTPANANQIGIQLGTTANFAMGTRIRDCFFTDAATLLYNIWCNKTEDTLIEGNWINSVAASGFVLADVNSTGTVVIGNQPDSVGYAGGLVKDNSGPQDVILIGRGGGSGCSSLSRVSNQWVFSLGAGGEVVFQDKVKLVGGLDASTGAGPPPAGGAGALPATPAGYVTVFINGTARSIPFY